MTHLKAEKRAAAAGSRSSGRRQRQAGETEERQEQRIRQMLLSFMLTLNDTLSLSRRCGTDWIYS